MTPNVTDRRERLALLLLWITPALWSVNYIVARKAPGVAEPHMLATARWALAALVLGVLAGTELWRHRAHLRRDWAHYIVLGTLGMLICGAWVYEGARSTSAMNIALIYSASPVLIAVGAVVWLGERFRLRQAAGVVLAMAGVLHVIVRGQWMSLESVQWVAGDGWIVLAMLSWAGYALLLKHWGSPLSPTARLAATCVGGVAVLLPFAVWEYLEPGRPAWSHAATGLAVAAALVPGVGAYLAYSYSQKVLGASRVAVSLYLGPLYAAVAAWGILGEPLGWHHAAGAALILPGIWLVTRKAPDPPTGPAPASPA